MLPWCAAACLLAAGTLHFLANLALRIWAAQDGCIPDYRWALHLSWKTPFLLALIVVDALFVSRFVPAARSAGMARGRAIALLTGVAATMVVAYGALNYATTLTWWGKNRWGFARAFPSGEIEKRSDMRNDEVEYIRLTTNVDSFRDDRWQVPAPQDGVNRVLLTGDSTIYGLSITETRDKLDAQIERRLRAANAGKWDVWNIATAPASLWYFSESIRRIAPAARPRYAVVYFHCDCDFCFMDAQAALADKPDWFYAAVRVTGLYNDLIRAESAPWPFSRLMRDPPVLAAGIASLTRLLDFAKAHDFHVIVFDAIGPCRDLDSLRDRPEVSFLTWRADVGLPCGKGDTKDCRFYDNPEYGFRSGHLTAKAMGHVADAITRHILELEGRRAPQPAPR